MPSREGDLEGARRAIAEEGAPLGRGTRRVSWDAVSDAVVKETRRRGPLTRWAVASRARRAWDAATALREAGVATPEPLACLEVRDRAYFVARFVVGRPLDVAKEGEEAAALCADLHAAHVVHGDFKPANLLVSTEGLVVLDLDAAKVTENLPARRARARDLGALVAYARRGRAAGRALVTAYLAAAPFETDPDAFTKAVLARSDLKLARWARA